MLISIVDRNSQGDVPPATRPAGDPVRPALEFRRAVAEQAPEVSVEILAPGETLVLRGCELRA